MIVLIVVNCALAQSVKQYEIDQSLIAEDRTLIQHKHSVEPNTLRLMEVARAEIGYAEEADMTTKYGKWAGEPNAQWCAEFLCWCVSKVDEQYQTKLLNTMFPLYSSSNVGVRWFLKQGRFIARRKTINGYGSQWYIGEEIPLLDNAYIPEPGDWVFFSPNAKASTTHVAVVEFCTSNTQGEVFVHVIEGNNPDKVQRAEYALTYERILGYGTVRELTDFVLKQGNQGKKVEFLQQCLYDLGYLDLQYVNGTFGPSTASAVRAYQKFKGKQATGIANQHTQLDLKNDTIEKYMQTPQLWAVQ